MELSEVLWSIWTMISLWIRLAHCVSYCILFERATTLFPQVEGFCVVVLAAMAPVSPGERDLCGCICASGHLFPQVRGILCGSSHG